MKREMIEVLPTDWSPMKTSLYFLSGAVPAAASCYNCATAGGNCGALRSAAAAPPGGVAQRKLASTQARARELGQLGSKRRSAAATTVFLSSSDHAVSSQLREPPGNRTIPMAASPHRLDRGVTAVRSTGVIRLGGDYQAATIPDLAPELEAAQALDYEAAAAAMPLWEAPARVPTPPVPPPLRTRAVAAGYQLGRKRSSTAASTSRSASRSATRRTAARGSGCSRGRTRTRSTRAGGSRRSGASATSTLGRTRRRRR